MLKTRKIILIADDDPEIVDVLTIMLEDAGYIVESTDDGQEVKDVKEQFPDLILLDIWMSGMDGRDICKYLKSQEHTKKIPVIIISATKDVEANAKAAGADDYIVKPFEMKDLLEKIRVYV